MGGKNHLFLGLTFGSKKPFVIIINLWKWMAKINCFYKWKYLNCNSKWIYENAWKIKEKWAFLWMEMGWKKSFINISWNEKWLVFRIEFSWEMDDENPFINIIWIWKWLMKISENWNRIINISEDWNRLMNISGLWKWIINTSEIFFWIIWWKNHDIHENKNPCPEFNGEKMHEQHLPMANAMKSTLCVE